MLEKLRIEFTQSRPRHSNDNGLAETKNGAIVRKHLGYSPIPGRFAGQVNAFCRDYLNPYVNFHRPCFFAESMTDVPGSADGADRVHRHDLAHDQPVEEHADGGELLFHGRSREGLLPFLDPGCDMHGAARPGARRSQRPTGSRPRLRPALGSCPAPSFTQDNLLILLFCAPFMMVE